MGMTATYSPEDNKLRLYADARLPRDLYERVKAAGFRWAPKQEVFVTPAWTPAREDFLLDLCGEIGDEDYSAAERSADRAERFEDYRDRRAAEAHDQADRFEAGPSAFGHQDRRRAERAARRHDRFRSRAVGQWGKAEYWQERTAGVIRHALYKELPSVRARRIKALGAERRKWEREEVEAIDTRRKWFRVAPLTHARARALANVAGLSFYRRYPLAEFPRASPVSTYEGEIGLWSALGDTPDEAIVTPAFARLMVGRGCVRLIRHARRWLAHLDNRLNYERAMQTAAGGTVADRTGPEKGGAVKCWASPAHGRAWALVVKVNKVSVTLLDNWGNSGKDFTRTIPFDKLTAVMTRAEVDAARAAGRLDLIGERGFILRDAPRPDPVAAAPEPKPVEEYAATDALFG